MLTEGGAKVLEYNARFGDPETQSILVLLETDLVEICEAILSKNLNKLEIKWRKGSAACVVLASKNYPAKAQTGDVIFGLEEAKKQPDTVIFHAGTSRNKNGEFITLGGRVLGVTATAETLDEAIKSAYKAVEKINWEGMQFRRDIGKENF